MRKFLPVVVLAALAVGALPMVVAPTYAAEPPAAAPAHYSVEKTHVGQMLDDPAADAILKALIPTVYANEMFKSAGRDLTLRDIQQYEPDALSDANLAKIQAELNKIPAKG